MAKITFKSKFLEGQRIEGFTPKLVKYVKVPKLTRSHCDVEGFRNHKKFGSYVNSALFTDMINRLSKELFPNGKIYIDDVPDNVRVDVSGFLAVVTVEV